MFVLDKKRDSSTWHNKICNGGGNKIFVLIFIISKIRSLISKFGVGMWDVFEVDKIIYNLVDIYYKFSIK